MARPSELMCPSADVDDAGARMYGLVVGTPDRPETAYLDTVQPITPELREMIAPASANEMFRITSRCISKACPHFDHGRELCRFGEKTVRMTAAVVSMLPSCAIRGNCRWWHQHGQDACLRCPQVTRTSYDAASPMRLAADPRVL